VLGGHSEAVNVEFESDFEINEVRDLLASSTGIIVQDNPGQFHYPMALHAHDTDAVYVGRLRKDEGNPRTLNMWIVSDNLRKGAATNAVQIAEYMLSQGYFRPSQSRVKGNTGRPAMA
jgi:aspartate-semialdehyde dehydrogenase